MKLKRLALIAVALVLAFTAAFAGCDGFGDDTVKVTSIEIVTEGLKTNYTVGDEFDYASVSISVIYSDETTKTLSITDDGVKYNTLDMSKAGTQTLTVTYEGKTASVDITIAKLTGPEGTVVESFDLPQNYLRMQREDDSEGLASNDRTKLLKGISTYKVGDDNGFVFEPDATVFDIDSDDLYVPIENVITEYTLYLVDGETETADTDGTYVTVKEELPNVYFFTAAAVGKKFRLEIKLSDRYDKSSLAEGEDVISADIEVVDGYNVYDQTGLSVMDNLNIKNWKAIKDAAGTLPWDNKPLADYNKLTGDPADIVKQVVLHADIVIDPDKLPDNYFWDSTLDSVRPNYGYTAALNALKKGETAEPELGYPDKLDGSLRDYDPLVHDNWHNFNTQSNGEFAEDYEANAVNMQKGVYNSLNTGLSGNGMQITYKTEGAKHRLYSVFDGEADKSPTGHWALFKFVDENVVADAYPAIRDELHDTIGLEPVFENVRLIGNMQRLASTEGDPAQLMVINTCTDKVTLSNTLVSRFYVVVVGDQHRDTISDIDVVNSKVFDMYSNMFYMWRATISITSSIMKEAGGPIVILCDGNRGSYSPDEGKTWMPTSDDNNGPKLIADNDSVLESWASGNEPWYQLNSATGLFVQIKSTEKELRKGANKLGVDYITGDGDTGLANVIAAVICEPGEFMKNHSQFTSDGINVSGRIYRGSEEFSMNSAPLPDLNGLPENVKPLLGDQLATNQGLIAKIPYTQAPMFYSGSASAIWVGGAFDKVLTAMGQPGTDLIGRTNDAPIILNETQLKDAWSMASSDWMFLTMRASAESPRFGVLLGDVHSIA